MTSLHRISTETFLLHIIDDTSKTEDGSKETDKEKEVKDGEAEQQSKKAEAEVNDGSNLFIFIFFPILTIKFLK